MARLLVAAVLLAVVASGPPFLPRIADTPRAHPDELAEAHGRPCPLRTPEPPSPDRFASALPALPAPERAWVCRYDLPGWRRAGPPRPVPQGDLPGLRTAMGGLTPNAGQRDCSADLGPRWMVVLDHGGDLTGLLVEGYGCRDVRLVAEPHRAGARAGGVLVGGDALLAALGLDH